MKTKNTNYKFNKKPIKTFKISNDKNKKNNKDDYSKVIMNLLEPVKIKEESKNNNEHHGKKKLQIINKLKFSSNNSSNRILKITLDEKNKNHKNNHIDIYNNNDNISKERKTANINKKQVAKKLFQSISEKNIKRDNKNSDKNFSKINLNINKEINSNKKKNNNAKQNFNIHSHIQKLHYNMINNNKERKNKSVDKRKERKTKNINEKQSMNLLINKNDMINYKKTCYQYNQYNKKSSKANINSSFNKRSVKINKIHRSPENLMIDISNGGVNFQMKEKNMNKTKNVNNDIISSSRLFNTKKLKKNNDNNSSKNIYDKNTKIKQIMDKKNKNNKNISSNSSNSKTSIVPKQEIIFKRIKVESIKIDLNLFKNQKNYSFISQEKTTTAENPQINDKINLTLRDVEIPKISKFNYNHKNSEMNLIGQTEMSELSRSIKTSLSIYKSRSLSKKREEKKRNKLSNLEDYKNEEKNKEKLNSILRSLSNLKICDMRHCAQKSEPKKLIDKIRKYKKLKQVE